MTIPRNSVHKFMLYASSPIKLYCGLHVFKIRMWVCLWMLMFVCLSSLGCGIALKSCVSISCRLVYGGATALPYAHLGLWFWFVKVCVIKWHCGLRSCSFNSRIHKLVNRRNQFWLKITSIPCWTEICGGSLPLLGIDTIQVLFIYRCGLCVAQQRHPEHQ